MKDLIIENAEIIFKNFSGRESQYNTAGDRNFCVIIPDESTAALKADGWNIKALKPKEEDEVKYYIPVKVNYDFSQPPRIYLIKNNQRNLLEEDSIYMLDERRILYSDVVIRPRKWTSGDGQEHIKAYLSNLDVEMEEDPFAYKYQS